MNDFQKNQRPLTYATESGKVGKWEAIKNQAFGFFREDMSFSGLRNDLYDEELDKSLKYAKSIGFDTSGYVEARWDGPTIYKASYNLADMSKALKFKSMESGDGLYTKTYQEVVDERNKEFEEHRRYEEYLAINSGHPVLSTLGGGIMAFSADPVDIFTNLLTGGTVTAARKANAFRRMLFVGGVVGAAEGAKQAIVYRNKKDINSPYTVKDALINTASAAIGAGALDFVGTYGSDKLLKYLNKENDDIIKSSLSGTKEAYEAIRANKALEREVMVSKELHGNKSPVDHLQHSDNLVKSVDSDPVEYFHNSGENVAKVEDDVDAAFEMVSNTEKGKRVQEYISKIDSDIELYRKMLKECNG